MNIWILGTLILSLISPISYTKSMLRGKAKPHRVTRLIVWLVSAAGILGVLHLANFAAQVFAFIFLARATYLLIMSFFHGVGGVTKLDKTCLFIGIIALVAYVVTGSGLLAVLLGIVADLIGYIPTFVKTYHNPSSEDPTFFAIEGLASFFGVVAVGSIQVGIIFPIYFVLCCVGVLGLIYRKKLFTIKTDWQ